jgi:hypothetical protein
MEGATRPGRIAWKEESMEVGLDPPDRRGLD